MSVECAPPTNARDTPVTTEAQTTASRCWIEDGILKSEVLRPVSVPFDNQELAIVFDDALESFQTRT